MRHYEDSVVIPAEPEEIFAYIDDHARFSSHMSTSSPMMAGSKMMTEVDEGKGQSVGSHIKMSGSVLGMPLSLDEVVTVREPPYKKEWETVGIPNLLVIGSYNMRIGILPLENKSKFTVAIDYELPQKNAWMGTLFGQIYARWCVKQMLSGTRNEFKKLI